MARIKLSLIILLGAIIARAMAGGDDGHSSSDGLSGATPQMPRHEPDGILDLIPPTAIFKLFSKLLEPPLELLGKMIIPLLEAPYHIAQTAWSLLDTDATLPGMTPIGGRMLSSGLLAGIASRVFDVDVVSLILQALQVEQNCREMAACEIGAYLLHQNRLMSPILTKIFKTLFSRTSNLWIPIRRGIKGDQCHKIYPACRKEFLMAR